MTFANITIWKACGAMRRGYAPSAAPQRRQPGQARFAGRYFARVQQLGGNPKTIPAWRRWAMRHSMPLWFGLVALLCGVTVRALDTPSPKPSRTTNSVTIPLEFHRGHMMIRARVNQSEPLLFMVDSGFSITMISPEQAVALALKR